MTTSLAIPDRVNESVSCFFAALDEANFFLELDQFEEAGSCLERARQMAGDDRTSLLLVEAAQLCALVEQRRHFEALSCIDACLREHDDLLTAPENSSFRLDLLIQRAVSLFELYRWEEALDAFRHPEVPQEEPEIQFHVGRCLLALEQLRLAEKHFLQAQRTGLLPSAKVRNASQFSKGLAPLRHDAGHPLETSGRGARGSTSQAH